MLLVLAASVAIASKAAMVFTLLLLVASGLTFQRRRLAAGRLSPGSVGVTLAGAVLLLALGGERAATRWQQLPALLQWHNPRLLAWRGTLRMVPDAGPFGIGPGNFSLAFPHYTAGLDAQVAGWWQFAHQDYLQALVEWGPVGFLLWSLVWLGCWWRQPRWATLDRAERFSRRCALLALAGLLAHAALDYPLQVPAIQLAAFGWLALLWSSPRKVVDGHAARAPLRDSSFSSQS